MKLHNSQQLITVNTDASFVPSSSGGRAGREGKESHRKRSGHSVSMPILSGRRTAAVASMYIDGLGHAMGSNAELPERAIRFRVISICKATSDSSHSKCNACKWTLEHRHTE